ncbi:MAG: tetratricopeptide repeat protein, partial [Myxococcota bacterium]
GVAVGLMSAAGPAHASGAAVKLGKPLVAVAPFTSASPDEYQWLGLGLAELILARLARSPDVHALSIRQWGAVLRERDQALTAVDTDQAALAVGRSLGARFVVLGTFSARWPDVKASVRVLDAVSGTVVKEATGLVHLEEALTLDGILGKAIFDAVGIAPPKQGMQTRSVYAWHQATLCREIVTWQSLGPRARPVMPRAAAVQAQKHCQAALALDPNYPEALEGLGIAEALIGDTSNALTHLAAAGKARKSPDLAELGAFWARWRAGQRDDAVKGLRDAITKRPNFLHARGTLGQALNELGRHEEAQKEFQAYLEMAPAQPWALTQLGYSLARLGKMDEALARTQEAVDVAPADPTFRIELASRHIDAKQLPQAEAVLRKVMEQDPKVAVAYLRLGYVYLLQDNRPLARAILEKAIVEADLDAEWRIRGMAHFDLAKLDMRERNRPAALERLRKAVGEGFAEADRIESDADLAALRDDATFKQLMHDARTGQGNAGSKP